jgi:hypothetical protein
LISGSNGTDGSISGLLGLKLMDMVNEKKEHTDKPE